MGFFGSYRIKKELKKFNAEKAKLSLDKAKASRLERLAKVKEERRAAVKRQFVAKEKIRPRPVVQRGATSTGFVGFLERAGERTHTTAKKLQRARRAVRKIKRSSKIAVGRPKARPKKRVMKRAPKRRAKKRRASDDFDYSPF